MSDRDNPKTYPSLSRTPRHVGFIMDGNGRWAKARNLPRHLGHRAGMENVRRILRAAVEFGIPIVTLYSFSTENWQRPQSEVSGILNLLREALANEIKELDANSVQLRHVGNWENLPPDIQECFRTATAQTRHNERLIVNIAFNYGGRQEIIAAVRDIVREGIPPAAITEEVFAAHLYTAGQPDPDLIIRTSGEMRVSNFMIWQGAYAEYYVTPVLWPDFDRDEFYKSLETFAHRERRYGGIRPA